ncbi:MAG: hypothetical protein RJB62_31 [Pseudomonadota bacterium]|jgi:prolyl oligopeptidase
MVLSLVLGGAVLGQDAVDDPFLWLEEVHGEAPLAWVAEQDAVALGRLKSDPAYQQNYDTVLALLNAEDRIPMGSLRGDYVFNFWQDAVNERGLWRRATRESYEAVAPEWEVLIDVDALARAEDRNWVFKAASCAPSGMRCLISLSPGGTDAVEIREFDLAAKAFLETGFTLAEAKSDASYIDDDTVLFSSDFGEGSMTASGYPRIVKLWRRGEALADAAQLFEGTAEDVGVWPYVMRGDAGPLGIVVRAVSFFESEYFYIAPGGDLVKLPLPLAASLEGMTGDRVLAILRSDWTPEGQDMLLQGALISFSWTAFLDDPEAAPAFDVLHLPGPRGSMETVAAGRDAVYVSLFENVVGSVHVFRHVDGAWQERALGLPEGGSTDIVSVNAYGPEAFFTYQGYLTPTTLYRDRGNDSPEHIKSLPARFDAEGASVAQYEATSKDGTKVPYFLVRPKGATGPVPTVLYGYGGFMMSETPRYWSSIGATWLPKGGAYAVANIRGGGEFGPAWHEAAMKRNRQRSYDDFIAVAEDMVARGFTTPQKLGIMGGSNGGLLVGAVATQRPDLFGAVVCQVPLLDMIRYMQIGAGASWEGEYGNPDNEEERAVLLSYSPYHNVRPGVDYPPMFFVTATSDDRVTPVHARKMAAKMAAQGHDYLFYENTEGGHAGAANNAQQAEMLGLTYTYFAQELGLSE